MSGLIRFLVLLAFSMGFSPDQEVLQLHPGQDVTLRCQVDGDVSIRAVEWTRPVLEPDGVLYFSDGHLDLTNQHPSFKDRVELVDRELKNGDVSFILRNIGINDNGMYECRVAKDSQSGRKKRGDIDGDPLRRITLEVTDSGSKNEDTNHTDKIYNHVGLTAVLVLVCSAVVVLVVVGVRKYKQHKDKQSDQAAADEAGGDQLI